METPPLQQRHQKAAVTSVAFSRAHNLIASASRDRTVRLWQPTVCVAFWLGDLAGRDAFPFDKKTHPVCVFNHFA
jgi:WD40 repeat protein